MKFSKYNVSVDKPAVRITNGDAPDNFLLGSYVHYDFGGAVVVGWLRYGVIVGVGVGVGVGLWM